MIRCFLDSEISKLIQVAPIIIYVFHLKGLACLLPQTLPQSQTQGQNHSCPVEARGLEGKGEDRFCVTN